MALLINNAAAPGINRNIPARRLITSSSIRPVKMIGFKLSIIQADIFKAKYCSNVSGCCA
jgi:hypothetical protein